MERPALVVDQAQLAPDRREPGVRIVLAQQQPVFGATGEHAVGLGGSLGNEVIDQHAEVRLAARRHPGLQVAGGARRIQARQQSLCGGFFVAGGAVDLAGEIEPAEALGFERGTQVARIEIVVLDRIAGPREVRLFEAGNAAHELLLDVERQAGRDAVRIDLVGVQAFRFDEDLVRSALGKTLHLVFDRGAIPGAGAFNDAGVHRRAVEPCADDFVGALIGVRNVTIDLSWVFINPPKKRKNRQG